MVRLHSLLLSAPALGQTCSSDVQFQHKRATIHRNGKTSPCAASFALNYISPLTCARSTHQEKTKGLGQERLKVMKTPTYPHSFSLPVKVHQTRVAVFSKSSAASSQSATSVLCTRLKCHQLYGNLCCKPTLSLLSTTTIQSVQSTEGIMKHTHTV